MCGIIGYVGERNAQQVVLDGLSRLEYRGYDSAGIAILDASNTLHITRAVGKLAELVKKLKGSPLTGSTGIGHTRWATHGKATEANAHPHVDVKGRFSLVHNGIIENFQTLKRDQLKGVKFSSETDTEVAAKLIGKLLANSKSLHDALRAGMKHFEGAYAIAAVSADHPDEIVVARCGSPLILGVGKGENFIASDVPAILPYTDRIIYLDEGESAIVRADGIQLFDAKGKPKEVKPTKVHLSVEAAEKGGYEHFMLKEIFEQPDSIEKTLTGRIKKGVVDLSELGLSAAKIKRIKRIHILACGTSFHAGLVAKYAIQEFAKLPVQVSIASEFRYEHPVVEKGTLVIAISQSGETTDTRFAALLAQEMGAQVLAVSNIVGSSIPRMADATLYTRAGIEIGVASTKAYTTQIAALLLFVIWLARNQEEVSGMTLAQEKKLVKELQQVPELARALLNSKMVGVKRCAAFYQNVNNFMYIGRRYNYATAFEGALKLKECSYIHAEGYGAGEMKHGPIALVEGTFPTIVICPASDVYDKTISSMREIKARDGVIVAVASEGDDEIKQLADYLIVVPKTRECFSPLLTALPMQLLAYYTAVNRGCDPDKPRNLAKAVTVE